MLIKEIYEEANTVIVVGVDETEHYIPFPTFINKIISVESYNAGIKLFTLDGVFTYLKKDMLFFENKILGTTTTCFDIWNKTYKDIFKELWCEKKRKG